MFMYLISYLIIIYFCSQLPTYGLNHLRHLLTFLLECLASYIGKCRLLWGGFLIWGGALFHNGRC